MSTSTSAGLVCAKIAEHLAQSVGPQRYKLWFNGSARLEYQDENRRLRISVPNRFVADWIGRHFQQHLRDAAQREVGADVNLDVHVDPSSFLRSEAEAALDDSSETTTAIANTELSDGATGSVVVPVISAASSTPVPAVAHFAPQFHPKPRAFVPLRHRLQDFIVGPSNELAFAAANRLVDDEAAGVSPLFIHGVCGVGKTHLLQGICRKMLDARPDAKVLYTTGEQFTNEFLEAVRSNRIEQFRRRIRKLDLLAVDDIHFIANKQATQQEFLHSFDAIEMSGARVALASDCHPRLIKQFSEALVSRCIRGMVVEVRVPEFTTRSRIIRVLAQRRGLNLMDSAVEELARRAAHSVREIEGTLTKLHALANLTHAGERGGEPIGHTLLARLHESELEAAPRKIIRFETVLATVAEQLQVQKSQINGSGRHAHVVLARSLVIFIARQMTSMSYPELAAALGRGHHSTVITAAQRVEKQLAANEAVTLPSNGETLPLSELIERLKHAIMKA